jgi:hypothetical protein
MSCKQQQSQRCCVSYVAVEDLLAGKRVTTVARDPALKDQQRGSHVHAVVVNTAAMFDHAGA